MREQVPHPIARGTVDLLDALLLLLLRGRLVSEDGEQVFGLVQEHFAQLGLLLSRERDLFVERGQVPIGKSVWRRQHLVARRDSPGVLGERNERQQKKEECEKTNP